MAVPERVIPIRAAPAPRDDADATLYEIRRKIYPRAVHGWFARWRWGLVFITQLVYYGTPWLTWNGRQAVLFDLGARKFYIFGVVFWPQDFIYLTVLLLVCAYSLFLFTAVAGRLWCGYACPQTVYTEIFLWIERKIEGDRAQRMKLDSASLGWRKAGLKAAKHAAWIALSLWTGFTLVGYFAPIRDLAGLAATLRTGPWESFWILFYGFATYGNAGWMREQVCKYMCPYARFQGAMFDKDTLVITYDEGRGEPRGGRSKSADPAALGLGACVDCNICVQVCPTGIDIRDGQQYECIGCAACVDACDQVMDKVGYPRGLIRYATGNSISGHFGWSTMLRRVFRTRVLIYTAVLWGVIGAAGASLYMRVPVKVDIIRDRTALAREIDGGLVENVYRLHVMNTDELPRRFTISATGLRDLQVEGPQQPLDIGPADSRVIAVRVRAAPAGLDKGPHRIEFHVTATDGLGNAQPDVFSIHEQSNFFVP